MHAETLRDVWRGNYRLQDVQLSLELSGSLTTKIVWDDPTFAPLALWWASRITACPPKPAQRAKEGTPGSKFAGGHRSRVTPVPIPNTEVKPATADGTAWETVWESRSLPAVKTSEPSARRLCALGSSCVRPPQPWHPDQCWLSLELSL